MPPGPPRAGSVTGAPARSRRGGPGTFAFEALRATWIASASWWPRRSGRATQVPAGAAVTAATRRPRSQREVIGNGTAGRFRLDGDDRPARSAQGRERARIAQRRARRARFRGEVHHGVEPATGLTARHQIVRRSLKPRRRRRHAEQPRDDAPDVDIQRRDRDAEGRGRDGSGRIGPDPRQGIQFGDRRRHATVMVRDDPPRTFAQREGPTVVAKPGPRREQLVGPGRRPGRPVSASGRRTAARLARRARYRSAATSPRRRAPATGPRPRGSEAAGVAPGATGKSRLLRLRLLTASIWPRIASGSRRSPGRVGTLGSA